MKKEKALMNLEILGKTFCVGNVKETLEVIPDIVKHVTKNLKG